MSLLRPVDNSMAILTFQKMDQIKTGLGMTPFSNDQTLHSWFCFLLNHSEGPEVRRIKHSLVVVKPYCNTQKIIGALLAGSCRDSSLDSQIGDGLNHFFYQRRGASSHACTDWEAFLERKTTMRCQSTLLCLDSLSVGVPNKIASSSTS